MTSCGIYGAYEAVWAQSQQPAAGHNIGQGLTSSLSALGSVCPGLYGDYWEICIQPSSSLWLLENGDALSPLQNPPVSLVCPNLPSNRCHMQSVCRVQVSISVLCGEGDCACGSLACTLPEELLMPLHVSRAAGEKRQLWGGIGFLSYSNRNLHVSCGWTISWAWSGSTEINGRSVVNHEYWTRPGGRLSLPAGQSYADIRYCQMVESCRAAWWNSLLPSWRMVAWKRRTVGNGGWFHMRWSTLPNISGWSCRIILHLSLRRLCPFHLFVRWVKKRINQSISHTYEEPHKAVIQLIKPCSQSKVNRS